MQGEGAYSSIDWSIHRGRVARCLQYRCQETLIVLAVLFLQVLPPALPLRFESDGVF